MSVALSTLLPRFYLKAPLIPEPIALFALREGAIAFCRETNITTEVIPAITVDPGVYLHPLVTNEPTKTRAVKALDVWYDGKPIDPITADDLAEETEQDWTVLTGSVLKYMQFTEGTIRLYRIPEVAGEITARVATAPSTTATDIDDMIADRWWRAVIAGALQEVYSLPDKPFTNPDAAMAQLGVFNAYVDEAKALAHKGYTRARSRTRAHSF